MRQPLGQLLLLGVALAAGCRGADTCQCQQSCEFCPGAVPAPVGTYVEGWNESMIGGAAQSRYVINRHEWYAGGNELGPEGEEHLAGLVNELQQTSQQIVIESEEVAIGSDQSLADAKAETHDLNEARRESIVTALAAKGLVDADQRVVIQSLDRVGLYGIEAPRAYNQLFFGGGMGNRQGGGGGRGGFGGGGMGGGGGIGGGGGGGFGGGGFF